MDLLFFLALPKGRAIHYIFSYTKFVSGFHQVCKLQDELCLD